MEPLYLETAAGLVPLDADLAAKYHLKKGMISPFSGARIVGPNGDFSREETAAVARPAAGTDREPGAEIQPGVMLTTSEILDFAHGEDSGPSGQ